MNEIAICQICKLANKDIPYIQVNGKTGFYLCSDCFNEMQPTCECCCGKRQDVNHPCLNDKGRDIWSELDDLLFEYL